jgi:hypothetical protein
MCGCSGNKKNQAIMNFMKQRQILLNRQKQANIVKQKQALANQILNINRINSFRLLNSNLPKSSKFKSR